VLVFVTGARGAIGQHVVRHCNALGHQVAGVGHGSWHENVGMPKLSAWINGSVATENLTELAKASGQPDSIVHLAGGSSVGASIAHPLEDFRRTAGGVQSLLDWTRLNAPAARVVIASSAAVYGAGHNRPIGEHAAIAPVSPYGVHKGIAEMSARMYSEQFGLNVSIVRLFSVYGPGLQKQFLWDIVSKLAQRQTKVELSGTGAERRDFLFIQDAAGMLLHAAGLARSPALVVNGCSGTATRMDHVVALILRHFPGASASFNGRQRAGDPSFLAGDDGFARQHGFDSQKTLEAGVVETIGWIRSVIKPRLADV
jgi:UDP-glucose 4-epimerase